jgi:hypothetical protein
MPISLVPALRRPQGVGIATARKLFTRPQRWGVPVLERLVHTPKDLIPSNLALMRIRVAGDWQVQENTLADQRTGGRIWYYRSIREARGARVRELRYALKAGAGSHPDGVNPFAVALPSVIVPAWNVVLDPEGTGFWDHVSLETVEPFEFDPRLFPDDVQTE